MGRRGPLPKPTDLKPLRGERADRVPAAPPRAAGGAPARPDHLDDVAAAEWDRVVGLLAELGTLAAADAAAIEVYAVTYARWRRALQRLAGDDALVEIQGSGSLKPSPYATIAASCERLMRTLLTDLNLTPAARARAQAPAEPEADPLAEFLSRRGGGA